MNYKRLILAVTAFAFFFSCNVREESLPLARRVSFQAVVADNPSSKTVLQGDGSVYWSPMDSISLFYGELGVQLIADNTEPVAQATFLGTLDEFPSEGEFWAVYPYDYRNTFDGQAITLVLPDKQVARAGTYAPGLFPSMARSTDYTLQFYNLCGGVKFSVASEGIESVIFKGNNGEILAGQVQAAFDAEGKPLVTEVVKGVAELQLDAPEGGFEVGKWYYIVSLPVTLSAGYTMTFLSNNELVAERSTTNSITIKRSIWGRITEADNVNQPDNQIWYTSTDGEVVNPYDATVFGASLVSNKYTPEKGVITFDGPVTSVGNSAFLWSGSGNARNLTSIRLPETVTSIGQEAFFQSFKLKEINFPDGVTSIGSYAFLKCEKLSSVELPQSLTSIGQEAFLYCHALTTVDIPSSVTSISSGAFAGCSNLESFTGNYASADGRALIVGTEMKAFAPAGLTSYKIPYGVTTVSNEVFRDLENLEEVIFPEGILSLGGAFYYCYGLKTLTIPSTVTSMYGAFLDACTVSDALYVLPTTPPTVSANNIPLFRNSNEFPIYVPAQSVEAYKTATGWSDYADRIQAIPNGISASKYLTFTSEGTTTISLNNEGEYSPVLYYSTDANTWFQWDFSELTFTADAPLYICGDNPDGINAHISIEDTESQSSGPNEPKLNQFTTSGDLFSVSGDIMSLLDKSTDITSVPSFAFFYLFNGCTQLYAAPELPATTLAPYCYAAMFMGCTNLTGAPELPATVLSDFCYSLMFYGCTSLSEAPELPATSLAKNCYGAMFESCTSLTTAPILPAATLLEQCYTQMFYNCSNLSYVKCLATDISADYCTENWLSLVSTTGTFVKAAQMDYWTRGGNGGIPDGWTVENEDGSPILGVSKYLKFTSNGTSSISLAVIGDNAPVLYFSYDGINWEQWNYEELEFTNDSPLFLCGNNPNGFSTQIETENSHFITSGDLFSAHGSIMSLLSYSTDLTVIPSMTCFSQLFSGCANMTIAPDLPATSLAESCYYQMFKDCTSLMVTPDLPSMELASGCYQSMFYGCSSLVLAADLPALTLKSFCYESMFADCSQLKEAPSISATVMDNYSCNNMFANCTSLTSVPDLVATTMGIESCSQMFLNCCSLTKAPALPAEILAESCYYAMFVNCSQLDYVKCLATDLSAYHCVDNWLIGVSAQGTFVKAPNAQWPTGSSGIPNGWTIENVQ